MSKRTVSGITLTLLLIGMLTLAFNIQPVKCDVPEESGTIYIRADGSVEPEGTPISSIDNITYTFTDNIYDEIVVERDNIVVDGAGYTLKGYMPSTLVNGINLTGRSNVTINNVEVKSFLFGILLDHSSNNTISGNDIISNGVPGILLNYSSNHNTIIGNNIIGNGVGIELESSSYNTISGNNITENLYYGIGVDGSNNTISGNSIISHINEGIWFHGSGNTVSGNDIRDNKWGIWTDSAYSDIYGNKLINNGAGIRLQLASNNIISGNNITNSYCGIDSWSSLNNSIYHNNFIHNTYQVSLLGSPGHNVWDDGYPSGGNYWSDHVCTGNPSDGSQPYTIDTNNIDHYPFQDPNGWLLPPPEHELIVYLEVPDHVQPDETSLLNATVDNRGLSNETSVPLQLLINGTIVDSVVIPELLTGSSYTLSYLWTPTVEGIYNITAYAPPVLGESFTANNLDTNFMVVGYPLISHWKFDEGSGTIAYDSVGANHGTIHGATWTTGIVGNALSFDGVDDYVSLSNSLPDLGSLTIGAWVYYTGGSNVATIFMDATTAGGNDFVFDMSSSGIGIRADKSGATLAYEDANAITGLDLGNAWHHITWTMTPSESKIYVDGDLKTTKGESGSNVGYHSANPSIGRWWDEGGSHRRYFNGMIDDVRIYNRALTEAEIRELYYEGATKTFDVVLDDIHYPVSILSNSTVSNFNFNETEMQISFDVDGESGTTGYCNVTIPKSLLKDSPWTIKIDDTPITEFDEKTNDSHTFLYFTYTHESPLKVTIKGTWVVPEFQLAIIMPLFMIISMLAVALAKRKSKTRKIA